MGHVRSGRVVAHGTPSGRVVGSHAAATVARHSWQRVRRLHDVAVLSTFGHAPGSTTRRRVLRRLVRSLVSGLVKIHDLS